MCRHAFVLTFIPVRPCICSKCVCVCIMHACIYPDSHSYGGLVWPNHFLTSYFLIYINILLNPTLATQSHGHTLELTNTYNCPTSEITNSDIPLSNRNLLSFYLACLTILNMPAPYLTRTYLLFPHSLGPLLSSLPSIFGLDPSLPWQPLSWYCSFRRISWENLHPGWI